MPGFTSIWAISVIMVSARSSLCVRLRRRCSVFALGLRRGGWRCESEMVAQRRPAVVFAVEASALQLRHDAVDEVVERAGKIRRHDDEAVGEAACEPVL